VGNIRRELTSGQIGVLTFDRPESSANIFDRSTLEELNEQLAFIEGQGDLRGLVFASAKKTIFLVGADLYEIAKLSPEQLRDYISFGQFVFNRIAGLAIPSVAAIHGVCPGGAFELALACDHRVASRDEVTKIGLPEVTLGLVPAWGGCTRLPRLIGVEKALTLITEGKMVGARDALEMGMIDEAVERSELMQRAVRLLERGKRPDTGYEINSPICGGIREKVLKKTGGHYPAPLKAIEIIEAGGTIEESLARELNAFTELTASSSTRNQLRFFFAKERAKKLRVDVAGAPMIFDQQKVAVIGAGTMGAGIAQTLIAKGMTVTLHDVAVDQLELGKGRILNVFDEQLRRGMTSEEKVHDAMSRISLTTDERALADADVVIEAATERIDLKKKIFAGLDRLVRPEVILATNTSALPIAEIAAATKDPSRVIGIHFFNPVHRMQLVEIVSSAHTKPEVIQSALQFVQRLGKLPVLVRDCPGFIANRILLPYLEEAARFFELGAAVGEIDQAMLKFGMPMGPLRLIDEIGADVVADIAATLSAAFPDENRVPAIFAELINRKLLGKKSRRGFYVFESATKTRVNDELRSAGASHSTTSEIEMALSFLMVNQAARCVVEQVASAADIDFAMILGLGFPIFRGGPLAFADEQGIQTVVNELANLEKSRGLHFRPCRLLHEMATAEKTFYGN
jgi:3-hydroxyacyl-CoA dehydrogenase/enoyl-CoA hydratase/3-hydroxybutyryl-CoA epimerase